MNHLYGWRQKPPHEEKQKSIPGFQAPQEQKYDQIYVGAVAPAAHGTGDPSPTVSLRACRDTPPGVSADMTSCLSDTRGRVTLQGVAIRFHP